MHREVEIFGTDQIQFYYKNHTKRLILRIFCVRVYSDGTYHSVEIKTNQEQALPFTAPTSINNNNYYF